MKRFVGMPSFSSSALAPAQRQAISFALRFAQQPFLPLQPYEGLLLEAFEQGRLTLDQVLAHVEDHDFAPARGRTPVLA
jgi:hypothetical protein